MASGVLAAASVALVGVAGAHTESDVVAVPTGEAAQVTLQPTHGCGDSPTVEVATRVPVSGAQAGVVAGWSADVRADGDATVIEWTGGVLPADEVGAFPVRFTAPDQPGELLTFPFVQVCEDGSELAWIDGDPEGEYPAPRLLVLPAGYEPAARIEDVPADAPGRQQLVEIVDVDNPGATTTTSTATATTAAAPAETSTTAAPTTSIEVAAPAADDGGDDGSALPVVLGIGGIAVVAAAIAVALRRRDRTVA